MTETVSSFECGMDDVTIEDDDSAFHVKKPLKNQDLSSLSLTGKRVRLINQLKE